MFFKAHFVVVIQFFNDCDFHIFYDLILGISHTQRKKSTICNNKQLLYLITAAFFNDH